MASLPTKLLVLYSVFVYVSAQGVTYYGSSNVRDQSRPLPHPLTLHPSSEYVGGNAPSPVYVPPPPVASTTSPGLVYTIPSNGFQPNPGYQQSRPGAVASQPFPSSSWSGFSRPGPRPLQPLPSLPPPTPSPTTEPPYIEITEESRPETSSDNWNPQPALVEPSSEEPALPVFEPVYRPPGPLRPPRPLLPLPPPQPIKPATESQPISTETPRPGIIIDSWNAQPAISEPSPAEPAVQEPVYSSPLPEGVIRPLPSLPPPTPPTMIAEPAVIIFENQGSEVNDNSTPEPTLSESPLESNSLVFEPVLSDDNKSPTNDEFKETSAAPEESPEPNIAFPAEPESSSGGDSAPESVVIVEPEKDREATELSVSSPPLPEAEPIYIPAQPQSTPNAQPRYIPGYIPTTPRPGPILPPVNLPERVTPNLAPLPLPTQTPPPLPISIVTPEPAPSPSQPTYLPQPPYYPIRLRDPEPVPENPEPVVLPQNPIEPIPVPAPEPIPAPAPEPNPALVPEPIPVPGPELYPAPVPELIPAPAPEPIPATAPETIPVPTFEPVPVPTPEPIVPAPGPELIPIPLPTSQPAPLPEHTIVLVPIPTPGPSIIAPQRPPSQLLNPSPGLAPVISPSVAAESKVIIGYKCSRGNGYYSLSGQCDSYVECQANLAWQRNCPDGLHFNPNAKYPEYPCAYPSEVKCVGDSSKQAPQPTNECPRRYGFFPTSDGDCSKYVNCQEGKATLMSCPFGLVFNDILSSCDWPENVPQCNPYAFKGFSCPAPPLDSDGRPSEVIYKFKYGQHCRMYVACQRGHPRLLRCDPGMSFDEDSKSCIDSDLVKGCNMT